MPNNLAQIMRRKLDNLPKKCMAPPEIAFVGRYLGTSKRYLGVKTGDVIKIAKSFVSDQKLTDTRELVYLFDKLFEADTFEEHLIGGKIFTLLKPEKRWSLPRSKIEQWLSSSSGWAEVDVICQSSYSGEEVSEHWSEWKKMIENFRESPKISLRRASLVLQTRAVREVDEPKMRALAYSTVEALKSETDGLITKAISWLLRSLTIQNKQEVRKYLLTNEKSLPRIAFRETMRKIEVGKK